ncbi:histone deacetylase family protein [Minwuia sp.]|uniref:histone deacetylase family protein n=1 Tax=Minwuia sp. TaxID=2493630 RepID=UPI003A93D449
MKVIYSPDQQKHDPSSFISSGRVTSSPECPERADRFLAAVTDAGHEVLAPDRHGIAPVAAIHGVDYLHFLETAHQRWSALPNAGKEVIPNVHPGRHMTTRPDHIVGQAGFFMADTACPIGAGTWEAALAGADCALTATDMVLATGQVAYALCRPPGHHAYADMAGGFCFLNNVAIAAQRAVAAGRRPAILDVDIHHGNGTQGIFYSRGDVMNVSVHADPTNYYPFFCGYAAERGDGAGAGRNLNLPLAHGSGDDAYLDAIGRGLDAVQRFGADILLISLGLDPQENDPLGVLKVTTGGFRRAGARVAAAQTATVIVQEGGYLCDELGANLAAFLDGFENGGA